MNEERVSVNKNDSLPLEAVKKFEKIVHDIMDLFENTNLSVKDAAVLLTMFKSVQFAFMSMSTDIYNSQRGNDDLHPMNSRVFNGRVGMIILRLMPHYEWQTRWLKPLLRQGKK